MDPATGFVAAAGINALSQLGGGIMGASGAAAQNAAARERNQNEMSMFMRQNDLNQWYFQKNFENELYLSGSAYQRSMADMKAAGLNPILAYQQGGAGGHAGSGQAAGGSMSDPMPANPGEHLGRGVSKMVTSALDTYQTYQTLENMRQQNDLMKAQGEKTKADTALSAAQTGLAVSSTGLTNEQIKHFPALYNAQTTAAQAAAQASSASAGLSAAQTGATAQDARRKEEWGDSWLGNQLNTIQQLGKRALNNITSGRPYPSEFVIQPHFGGTTYQP